MKTIQLIIVASIFLYNCKPADLRTSHLLKHGVTEPDKLSGRKILMESFAAQGFDKLTDHRTYSVVGHDHWQGIMGKIANPWPVNNELIGLRYEVNTFNGQYEVLEGDKKGAKAGLQSWRYYEYTGGDPVFRRPNEKIRFVLPAFQYFFELTSRLANAPTICYAGEEEYDGKSFELVFVTWQSPEPTMEYDQYLLWIEKATRQLTYVNYTVRDNYLPGPRGLYGSIHFTDFRPVDGIQIPFVQTVFLNDFKSEHVIHQLQVSQFEFDTFDPLLLHIDTSLQDIGDAKP